MKRRSGRFFCERNFETLCTINSEFLGRLVNFNFLWNVMCLLTESVLRSSRRCVSQEIYIFCGNRRLIFVLKGYGDLWHHGPV